MDPTPELRALLHRRKIAVEGSTTNSPHLGGRCTASAPAAARLPPNRVGPQSGQPAAIRTSVSQLGSAVPRQSALSARLVRPGSGDFRQRQTLPGAPLEARGIHGPELQLKVSALTLRNEQLTSEVEKMKAKLQDETGAYSEERNLLLAETDELLAETDRMTVRSRRVMQQREELRAETNQAWVSRELHAEVQELTSECAAVRRRNTELQAEEEASRRRTLQGRRNSDQLTAEVEDLRQQNSLLTVEVQALRRSRTDEMDTVMRELESLRKENLELRQASSGSCSESRLRSVLVSASTTSTQLRQAVGAVESLLDEARRELAAKQLRERRAAFEQLHEAVAKADEENLDIAIKAARAAEVDAEDIEKAEAKLTELRSLTAEQRAARAAREVEAKKKKDAFLLVKKDDASSLEALLVELTETGIRWQDWRDYAGRTMWHCAQELRATTVQRLLAPLLDQKAAGDKAKAAESAPRTGGSRFGIPSGEAAAPAEQQAASGSGGPAGQGPQDGLSQSTTTDARQKAERIINGTDRPAGGQGTGAADDFTSVDSTNTGSPTPSPAANSGAASSSDIGAEVAPPERTLTPEEEEKLKSKGLRAVVQDDADTLHSILDAVPSDVWSKWRNRAGKDLLTLSTERGSSTAYSMLAKALGLVKELRRETFEEREAVWVFPPGEVQPRRATVLEDTPEEADEIYIEYWDGDQDPEHVERCLVRKMNS